MGPTLQPIATTVPLSKGTHFQQHFLLATRPTNCNRLQQLWLLERSTFNNTSFQQRAHFQQHLLLATHHFQQQFISGTHPHLTTPPLSGAPFWTTLPLRFAPFSITHSLSGVPNFNNTILPPRHAYSNCLRPACERNLFSRRGRSLLIFFDN
jgi:hypothetical protein